MPSIPAARREQSPPPPAKRNAWYCRHCPGYPKPLGWGQNAHAAELAGLRHFRERHDDSGELRDRPSAAMPDLYAHITEPTTEDDHAR